MIKEFVTGCPKNYAFKLTKPQDDGTTTCCKVRGITLNHKNALQINYELLREIVVNRSEGARLEDDRIIRRLEERNNC